MRKPGTIACETKLSFSTFLVRPEPEESAG
jgi:hypothetical protein